MRLLLVLILFFWSTPCSAEEILQSQPGEMTVPASTLVNSLNLKATWSLGGEVLYLSSGDKRVTVSVKKTDLPLPPVELPASQESLNTIRMPLQRSLNYFGGSLSWQGHRLVISPQEASKPVSTSSKVSFQDTKKQIQKLLANEKGTYGVYLLDLKTMTSLGIQDNTTFTAASTIKVPLNLYLYDLSLRGKEDLTQTLTQGSRHYEEGTGILRYRSPGSSYSLRELARLSIRESDNVATNMLMEHLGRQNFVGYLEDLGGQTLPRDRNITSPRDMGTYLLSLLNLQNQSPQSVAPLLLDLENTKYRNRIPRYLPKNVLIANKIGTWTRSVHDAAIVYHPINPYILCVFSKDVDPDQGEEVIAQISRLVYQDQSKR